MDVVTDTAQQHHQQQQQPAQRESVRGQGVSELLSFAERQRDRAESSRHARREQLVSSKRHRANPEEEFGVPHAPRTSAELAAAIAACSAAGSAGAAERLTALRALRRILAAAAAEPSGVADAAKLALSAGVVPILDAFLATANDSMQAEAVWCITNLASGPVEQTKELLPLAPRLVVLLGSSSLILQEQAAWALANIASDSTELRDPVVRAGAIPALAALLRCRDLKVAATAAFALTNIARGSGTDTESFGASGVYEAIPTLLQTLNEGLAVESLWLASYLTARDPRASQAILAAPGALEHLVAQLEPTATPAIAIPALRVLGNVACVSDEAIDALLSRCPGALAALAETLRSCEHRAVLKESLWVISNVAAGSAQHAEALLAAGLLEELVRLVKDSAFEIRKEAAYAVMNLTGRKPSVVVTAVDMGALPGFLTLIRAVAYDAATAGLALSFVEKVLAAHPTGVRLVEEAGGIDAMETLQVHDNDGLYQHASALIDRYYNDVGDESMEVQQEAVQYPPWRTGAQVAAGDCSSK